MSSSNLSQAEIDALFTQTGSGNQPLPSTSPGSQSGVPSGSGGQTAPPPVAAAAFPTLAVGPDPGIPPASIGMLANVDLEVTVNLGQTQRSIREILALGPGSVVQLDRLAGEAVDVMVNGRLMARGEVVVIGENFGVRITELLEPGGTNPR